MKSRALLFSLALCAVLAPALAAFAAEVQTAQPAQDFMKDVIYNELRDRQRESYWQYHIEKRVGSETFAAVQVETRDGPVNRVFVRNGTPLTVDQRRQEDARLARLLRDSPEQIRVKQRQEEDEQRLERLMKLMPDAFLYDYDGMDGGLQRLKFRPNPAFTPPTYEARIFHALAGTVWINPQQKRLAHLEGSILNRVDFGYGLLGHVEKGGTFELRRQQVSSTHWKTSLVEVHVVGRIILFKTISKDQREVRSDFKPVPAETSLQQAREMLDHPQERT